MSDRYRGWVFTINNYTPNDELDVYALEHIARYVCCGAEVGESGTPHLQGYVEFENKKSLNQLKEMFSCSPHFENRKGTPKAASDYCKKDGNFFEAGTLPMDDKTKGEIGKAKIQERWALAKAGLFEQLPPEQIKTYEYIYTKFQECVDLSVLDNVWIQGRSGCGKSRYVRENFPEHYSKPMSKWWDGYKREEVVLLDDFDPSHGKFLAYFLKTWADHYAFNAEVKGGMWKIRPKKIIVTSQYSIDQCFEGLQDREAIKRRFQVLELAPLDGEVAILPTFNA